MYYLFHRNIWLVAKKATNKCVRSVGTIGAYTLHLYNNLTHIAVIHP
jgi:hypothetical protein